MQNSVYLERGAFLTLAKEQAVFWQCSLTAAIRTMRRIGIFAYSKEAA